MWEMILESLLFKDGILMGILFWIVTALFLFMIFLIGAMINEWCYEIYAHINTAEVVEEMVFATVVDKDCDDEYTTFVNTGKVITPIYHSASYDVYLEYDGEEFVLDDEKLYYSVKKNDKIPAKLVKYLSKEGKVLKTDIEVEKDS